MDIPKDYSQFSKDYYKTPPSRAEASMQPESTLSEEEAEALKQIMKEAGAKPKIKPKKLPKFR